MAKESTSYFHKDELVLMFLHNIGPIQIIFVPTNNFENLTPPNNVGASKSGSENVPGAYAVCGYKYTANPMLFCGRQ